MKNLIFVLCLLSFVHSALAAETYAQRMERIAPVEQGEILIRPTFCACSIVYGADLAQTGPLALEYRRQGDTDWQREERFPYFDDAKNFRGNLIGLEEDTSYDVRVCQGGNALKTSTFRTWASEVPIAETRVIDPATVATFPIQITDKGTADGWIRYVVKDGAVLKSTTAEKLVFEVNGAEYVVFDDMTLCGATEARNVIKLTNSHYVRIRNCEIYGWSRVGVPRFDVYQGGKYYTTKNTSGAINFDPAININTGCQGIVVERCYIHDPLGRSSSWYYSHPAGPEAVMMYRPDHSTVLRYNDFVGSDFHRWNDAVEGSGNFDSNGGFNRDADVYGNYMSYCDDDCIELDGGMQNVRCFLNRFENALCGVSIQGCMVSPVYLWQNLFSGMADEQNLTGQTVKTDHSETQPNGISNSVAYVSENIMMGRGSGISMRPSLAIKMTDNAMYDGNKVGNFGDDVTKCHPDSVNDNNDLRGASTDATADGMYPYRPLPYKLSRTRISGVTVKDGKVTLPSAGTLDFGRAVFRYTGADAVNRRQIVSSVRAATDAVTAYDLRSNVTFVSPIDAGPIVFVKTGPGDMILDGASPSTAFQFCRDLPDATAMPAGVGERFFFPGDGSAPTTGCSTFTVLEGRFILNQGAFSTKGVGSSKIAMLGGWTADEGEQEKDVSLIVNGGTMSMPLTFHIGKNHGFAGFNTPDGPARAELILNGGTFTQGSGKVFYLGSRDAAPPDKTYNTEVRMEVNKGATYTHTTSASGLYIPQSKGQKATLVVNGGTLHDRTFYIGSASSKDDTTATVLVEIANGGLFECETMTVQNGSVKNPPPVEVVVRDGGTLLVDKMKTGSYTDLKMLFDGATLGTMEDNGISSSAEKCVLTDKARVSIGAKGLTVLANTVYTNGTPTTVLIQAPIVSGVENGSDGGITFVTGAGNVVRLESTVSCSGGYRVEGPGQLLLTSSGSLVFDVPEGEVRTFDSQVTGEGTIVKRGLGRLVLVPQTGFAGRVIVEQGTVGFPDGSTFTSPLEVSSGAGIFVPAGERVKVSGLIVSSRLAVEGEGDLVLANKANNLDRIVLDTANVICGAASVCTNAALEFVCSRLEDGVGCFDLNGYGQSVGDIITPVIEKGMPGCQILNSLSTAAALTFYPLAASDCYVKFDGNLSVNYPKRDGLPNVATRFKNRCHSMNGYYQFTRSTTYFDEGSSFPNLKEFKNSSNTIIHLASEEEDALESVATLSFSSFHLYVDNPQVARAFSRLRPKLTTNGTPNFYVGADREISLTYWYNTKDSSNKVYLPAGEYTKTGGGTSFASAGIVSGTVLVWSDNAQGTRSSHTNLVWAATAENQPVETAANWTLPEGVSRPTFKVPLAKVNFAGSSASAVVSSRVNWGGINFTAASGDFSLKAGEGAVLGVFDNGFTSEPGAAARVFTVEPLVDNWGDALKIALAADDTVHFAGGLTNITDVTIESGVARFNLATVVPDALNLTVGADGAVYVPEGEVLRVRHVVYDGEEQPVGSYTGGFVTGGGRVRVATSSKPAVEETITWNREGADGLVSVPANWENSPYLDFSVANKYLAVFANRGTAAVVDGPIRLRGITFDALNGFTLAADRNDGALAVDPPCIVLGSAGITTVGGADDPARSYRIGVPIELSGNTTISIATNDTLAIDGDITGTGNVTVAANGRILLSGSNTFSGTLTGGSNSQMILSGVLGVPNDAGSLSVNGGNGSYVCFSNAVVHKKLNLTAPASNVSHTKKWFTIGANSTNVVYRKLPNGNTQFWMAGKNSKFTAFGGAETGQKYTISGACDFEFIDGSVVCTGRSKGESFFSINDKAHVVFDCAGCRIRRLTFDDGGNTFEFRRSGVFAAEQAVKSNFGGETFYGHESTLDANNGSCVYEFNSTTQQCSVVVNSLSELHGSAGSLLVLRRGGTLAAPVTGALSIGAHMTNIVEGVDDGVTHVRGVQASSGSLMVSAGTLELDAGASWLNGRRFFMEGTGVLKLNAADQIHRMAGLIFADLGRLEIPNGVTVLVRAAEVNGVRVPDGTYTSASTGPMFGRISGGGTLIIARRGTMFVLW